MAIPLLGYPLSTQNGRVSNLAGDNSTVQSQLYPSSAAGDDTNRSDMDAVIEQAYRQVFFHAMRSDREPFLESQLRSGNITVRDFIRGLLLSERFQQGYYQCSSNYRMVDQVVGRVLGRPTHGDAERRAWSIVIGEKGFTAFVDAVLDSPEYMESFGYDLVPQQRSRVLPGRSLGRPRSTSNSRATGPTGAMPCRIELPATRPLRCSSWRCRRPGSMANLLPSPSSSGWAWRLSADSSWAVWSLPSPSRCFAADFLDGAFQPPESGHLAAAGTDPGLRVTG
jgi:hypothetical protein